MAQARIFDRELVRRRRERAASTIESASFLIDEMVERLVERAQEIHRPLKTVLVLGSHRGRLAAAVQALHPDALVVETDISPAMLDGARPQLVVDEEMLPFAADRFDAVLSAGVLHRIDDLPGTLSQIRWCLKPDGLLLAVLTGGDTLVELRSALTSAETSIRGGSGPRVAPCIEVRDAGALLQRAGFALPMADLDRIRVGYRQPLQLLRDLRAMGETNVLTARPREGLRRDVLGAAMAQLAAEADAEPATVTFDLVFLTGWKPHESQPKPVRRGSGRIDLAAALGVPGA